MIVGQIDAHIPLCTLSDIQDLLGVFLQSVTVSPSAELLLGTAAEFQQLLPVLFKEVQNPGNDCLLLFLGVAKGSTVDVDMKATGTCLMGQVAQLFCFVQHLRPGHLSQVKVK